jgi:hypothetical protein
MNTEEKAKELINNFKPLCGGYNGGKINKDFAKQSAIIAINEIIAAIPTQPSTNETERLDAIMYWINVKQEIENI